MKEPSTKFCGDIQIENNYLLGATHKSKTPFQTSIQHLGRTGGEGIMLWRLDLMSEITEFW